MSIKKGDLALVIKALHKSNVGRVVEVLDKFSMEENSWYVTSPHKMETALGMVKVAHIPAAHLKKISGPESKVDDEKDESLDNEKILDLVENN